MCDSLLGWALWSDDQRLSKSDSAHPTGWSSMTLTADGELKTGALSFSSVTNTRAVTEPQRL